GKIVFSSHVNFGETGVGLNIGHLPNGVYFVKALNANQIVSTGKFVIRR
ncbi:MAG: Secretion system C-terminal sorting domain, partial [Bacteroidota bacterium]